MAEPARRGRRRRPRTSRALPAGLVLIVVGLAAWALYGVSSGREDTVQHPNGPAPTSVQLNAGHQYWLAVPGGIDSVRAAGVDPTRLACFAAAPAGSGQGLAVTGVVDTSNGDTKFVDRIGSFYAARSGHFHVTCTGLGTVYVANAADAGFEWSGFWLLLASGTLLVGFALFLSGLRGAGARRRASQVGT